MTEQIETLFSAGNIELALLLAESQGIDIETLNVCFADVMQEVIVCARSNIKTKYLMFTYKNMAYQIGKAFEGSCSGKNWYEGVVCRTEIALTFGQIQELQKQLLIIKDAAATTELAKEQYYQYTFQFLSDKDILRLIKYMKTLA